jgi:ATP-dependent DNA ligase
MTTASSWTALASAVLCAFDLLELDGRDLRREQIEKRKALLAKLLKGERMSIGLAQVLDLQPVGRPAPGIR